MVVSPLKMFSVQQIEAIMREGRPWLPQSTDYWLWQTCFGLTSFIAAADKVLTGGILACVNQSRPDELYIDQLAVQAQWRGRGVTRALFEAVENEARRLGCKRLWLSTDPANPAVRAWPALGYESLGVRNDFKGPGKHRAIFEKRLA
jgi:GNAT superfamily N-acetyltransferase